MKKFIPFISLNKRQKLVSSVFFLTIGLFISQFLNSWQFIVGCFVLSFLSVLLLFLILRNDIKRTFFLPLLVLPFLFTLSFSMFYLIVPHRMIYRSVLCLIYAFGTYSLYLTQNIFAVSSTRTITLLRSARIVSFVITIVILYLLFDILFSFHLPIFVTPVFIALLVFFLDYQSLWMNTLEHTNRRETFFYALVSGLAIGELAGILSLWAVNASLYSLFLTGIYYTYSGLSHAWLEKRLFKGLLWEYVWVGILSIIILMVFSQWGI